MDYPKPFKIPKRTKNVAGNSDNSLNSNGGVALFMVIASMTMLSILVTEFIYTAQVNQRLAFDGLDQVQAIYLAKSGFKLSLLRLKAYQQIKAVMGTAGGNAQPGAAPAIPQNILDQVWSFPFIFPIPDSIPGLSMTQKEEIKKFTDSSSLNGNFTALIESESSKYNLNSILAPFAASPIPDPSASAVPSPTATPSTTASPGFSPDAAREALQDYLSKIILQKFESDEDFAADYRDLKVDELADKIFAWSDHSYAAKFPQGRNAMKVKQAPFYTLAELHMIDGMDDVLFGLITPNLTVSTTPGINVNTMKDATLKALVPKITKDEATDFFKFRDKEDADNHFKKPDDFFSYVKTNIASFGKSDAELDKYKGELVKKNVLIVTDETTFKITVQSKVNKVTRILEAWVTLKDSAKSNPGSGPNPNPSNAPSPQQPPSSAQNPQTVDPNESKTGLRVTFMRIL